MSDYSKKIKKSRMFPTVLFLVLGIALLIWPGMSSQLIFRGLGVVLLAYGLFQIIPYIRSKERTLRSRGIFVLGIIFLVMGAWIAIQPDFFKSALPIIIGVILVIHGALDLQQSVTLKKNSFVMWWLAFVFGLLTMVFGLILIANPISAMDTMTRVIGLFLIYDGVSDIWIQTKL